MNADGAAEADDDALSVDRGWRYYARSLVVALSGLALVSIAPQSPLGLVLVLAGVVLQLVGSVVAVAPVINSQEMDDFGDSLDELRDAINAEVRDTINSEGDDE